MSDEIDEARVGIQIDRAGESGAIETDVAAHIRARLGPVRLPTPYNLTTYPKYGVTCCQFEWRDGNVIRSDPGTVVTATLADRGTDYAFTSMGRQFVVWLPR